MGAKIHSRTITSRRNMYMIVGSAILLVMLIYVNARKIEGKNYVEVKEWAPVVNEQQPLRKIVEKDLESLGVSREYPAEVDDQKKEVATEDDDVEIDPAPEVVAEKKDDTNEEEDDIRGVIVDELGGFLFTDGIKYESAPVFPKVHPMGTREYAGIWNLLRVHEEFFNENPHRQFIPHLNQEISRAEFHEVFRKTSTPVVIPFDKMRHLGVVTKGYTIKELADRFPYKPSTKKKLYSPKSGLKDGLDLGPALYAISQDEKLAKSGFQRNFPRNLMIKSKYLQEMGVSRPPFVDKTRFQPPTVWMGTSTSDTKFHHDCCDNFVMMIAGTKRWYIAPPTDTQPLRPIRCDGAHQSLCWASVKYPNDPNPSPQNKQKLSKLNPIILDLKAGEMLYLPAGWWHHIENLGPTVMVNFWTLGCENVGLQLEKDPFRRDRSDFMNCPAVRDKSKLFIES